MGFVGREEKFYEVEGEREEEEGKRGYVERQRGMEGEGRVRGKNQKRVGEGVQARVLDE